MKQINLLCLAILGLCAAQASATPLHLEFSFGASSADHHQRMSVDAYEIVNGSEAGYASAGLLSSTWDASTAVDISEDFASVSFRSFRYSQSNPFLVDYGSLLNSFNLGFFGTSPYEIRLSSVEFSFLDQSAPLSLDGSFRIRVEGLAYSVQGQRMFLGESQLFSIIGNTSYDSYLDGQFQANADLSLVDLTMYAGLESPQISLGSGAFRGLSLELKAVARTNGVSLRATAALVPEPGTFLIVGVPLGLLALLRCLRWSPARRTRLT